MLYIWQEKPTLSVYGSGSIFLGESSGGARKRCNPSRLGNPIKLSCAADMVVTEACGGGVVAVAVVTKTIPAIVSTWTATMTTPDVRYERIARCAVCV